MDSSVESRNAGVAGGDRDAGGGVLDFACDTEQQYVQGMEHDAGIFCRSTTFVFWRLPPKVFQRRALAAILAAKPV